MKDIYESIIKVLKKYVIMDERYYPIVALWVIGTYVHKTFHTYPYLYFNAMKGSGKSRMLHLLANLSHNGKVIVDMTQAVLFRTAANTAFFIDELENIDGRERSNLKLLLNSAYKHGTHVRRMRKVHDEQVVEEFLVFTPIAMANIEGMNDVLQDRCITIILEKSFDSYVTRMVEDWDSDPDIQATRLLLKDFYSSLLIDKTDVRSVCMYTLSCNIHTLWNELLYTIRHTLYTHNTQHTQHTQTVKKISSNEMLAYLSQLDTERINIEVTDELVEFIKKLWDCNLNGRSLEIFLPIIMIAYNTDRDMVDDIIDIAEKLTYEKKMEDIVENRDMSFVGFLINYIDDNKIDSNEFVLTGEISREFKTDDSEDWLTPRWVGSALKRQNLIIEKNRSSRGIKVRLNVEKIKRTAKKLGIIDAYEEYGQKTVEEVIDEDVEPLGVPDQLKKRGSK